MQVPGNTNHAFDLTKYLIASDESLLVRTGPLCMYSLVVEAIGVPDPEFARRRIGHKGLPWPMPYDTLKGAFTRFATAVFPDPKPAAPVPAAPWKLDTGAWNAELLKHLEWRRLEELAVAYFDALGLTVRVTPGLEGADIGLHADGSKQQPATLARCKAWNAYGVGIKPVAALRAKMAAEGIARGMMLSAGRFTQEARTFAAAQDIELIDGAAFLARIAALPPQTSLALLRFATEGDFLTPTCPSCAVKMLSRQSTQGGRKFWGCPNYPRCKQISYASANAPA